MGHQRYDHQKPVRSCSFVQERAKVSAPAFTGERLLARTRLPCTQAKSAYKVKSVYNGTFFPPRQPALPCREEPKCVLDASSLRLYRHVRFARCGHNITCSVVAVHKPYSCTVLSFFLSARLCPCLLPHLHACASLRRLRLTCVFTPLPCGKRGERREDGNTLIRRYCAFLENTRFQSPRSLSTGQLHISPRFHPPPIYPVVCRGPYQIKLWRFSSWGALHA